MAICSFLQGASSEKNSRTDLEFIHPCIHSFIHDAFLVHQAFTGHLLCARRCSQFWDTTERQAVNSLCYNSGEVCEATEGSRVKKPHDVRMFSTGPSQSLSALFPCSVTGRLVGSPGKASSPSAFHLAWPVGGTIGDPREWE